MPSLAALARAGALALGLAAALVLLEGAGPAALAPLAGAGDVPPAPWHVVGLPQQTKPFTRFIPVTLEGQRVLRVEAELSYGNLVHPVSDEAGARRMLSWRWRVDEPILQADLRRRDGDDTPIKVCAMFDHPLHAVPFVERQVLRVARMRGGEVLPAASVCYVWDAHMAAGAMLDNAFTRRIRYVVLQGPHGPLHQWMSERRDIAADFLRLFGDEASSVPPLIGVAVGADADNTRSHSVAHVADLVLE